jgi:hypothetical protein
LILSWPGLTLTTFTGQLENLYGFLALFGVISLALMGMMHKIVPFLVWYYSYSRQIGKSKVPALADLYSTTLQKFSFWTYLAGLLACSAGILLAHPLLIRLSNLTMLAGASLFAVNIATVLRHLLRPQLSPLSVPARPSKAIQFSNPLNVPTTA